MKFRLKDVLSKVVASKIIITDRFQNNHHRYVFRLKMNIRFNFPRFYKSMKFFS